MLFMSIYTYEPGQRDKITERRLAKGRNFPEGLKVIGEWVDLGGGRGFVVTETDDPKLLIASARAWSDLMKIESVPIMDGEVLMKLIQSQ